MQPARMCAGMGRALLAATAALFLRGLLAPVFGEQNPYHTAWASVVFSAWYCGVGPSILAVLVNLLGIWYWFLPPTASWNLANPSADIAGMVGFLIFSGVIVFFGEAARRSLTKSRAVEEELKKAHTELERTVEERTRRADSVRTITCANSPATCSNSETRNEDRSPASCMTASDRCWPHWA